MSLEFTGERVIPGQVDTNLWNEHFARYAFAARLARHRRTLDAGCGTGYGAGELATTAAQVTAIDLSSDAVKFARDHYPNPRIRWAQASCEHLPFSAASFDLVVAFEVIEHLSDWRKLLAEAQRVLAPGGQFVVSTPNKDFYAESRAASGPNPFHTVEFTFAEFREALAEYFPHVSLFLEDHTEGVLFRSLRTPASNEVRLDQAAAEPEHANFFVAVCALSAQTGSPNFIYLPRAANLLKERSDHIAKLERELALKNEWLETSRRDHAKLHAIYQDQSADLAARTKWAHELNEQLAAASQTIQAVQAEVQREKASATELATAYEAKVRELEEEMASLRQWGETNEQHLTTELEVARGELGRCLDALHTTEATLEERTAWAMSLNARVTELEGILAAAQISRWIRLGRVFRLGPALK